MSPVASNPLPYLVRVAWRHAAEYRMKFLLYVAMSIFAMAIYSLEPLIIGRLLNLLQNTASLAEVFSAAVGYVALFGSRATVHAGPRKES